MNEAFYRQTSRIEDNHWWFRHRRRLIDALLTAEGRGRRGDGIALDVGCGSGGNLRLLGRHCDRVVGLDLAELPLRLARAKHPGSLLVRADANRLADLFPADSFDLIALFNVLYHRAVEDESVVLAGIVGMLRPGGCLVLTEPAFPILFRRHDRLDHGKRRYRLAQFKRWIPASGLTLCRASYFNGPSFLPALALATIERARGRTERDDAGEGEVGELRIPPTPLNRLLAALLRVEVGWIRRGGRIPLGVGVVLLAHKPVPVGETGPPQVRT